MFEFAIIDSDGQPYGIDVSQFNPDTDKKWLTGVWQKLCLAVENAIKADSGSAPDWCAWEPWAWAGQSGKYAGRKTFVARCGSDLVGFVNVWEQFPSQHESANVLYVEHLGVFPGSLPTRLWMRKFKQVGTALLAYSIKLSQDGGSGGRIGLHSENSDSTAFYRRVEGLHPEAPLFFPDKTGVIGPTPHGSRTDGAMLYLETRPEGALAFLEDYRYA